MNLDWNTIVPGCVEPVVKNNAGEVIARNVVSINCVPAVFQVLVNAGLLFAGIIAVFLIVFAGIKFILSGGDAKKVDSARKTITFALIGLIIIFVSFFIISFIGSFSGTTCINQFGFNVCPTATPTPIQFLPAGDPGP